MFWKNISLGALIYDSLFQQVTAPLNARRSAHHPNSRHPQLERVC